MISQTWFWEVTQTGSRRKRQAWRRCRRRLCAPVCTQLRVGAARPSHANCCKRSLRLELRNSQMGTGMGGSAVSTTFGGGGENYSGALPPVQPLLYGKFLRAIRCDTAGPTTLILAISKTPRTLRRRSSASVWSRNLWQSGSVGVGGWYLSVGLEPWRGDTR